MPESKAAPRAATSVEPTFRGWMGSMWLYTLLRFGLFGALWGILYLCGVPVFISALIGLVLSVPLSLVLLAKPRARFTAQLEARVNSRIVERADLDTQLDPDADARDADLREAHEREARAIEARKAKSRRGTGGSPTSS
ncbi:DUF4229 domain-containing protein [uncultured Jatrophihabitans sp.]|uniref:DUF4229 domain-containing protein n=1 Tax=uncultured Jatrophihabitans sp. TaxID=1610747 RepID=UPI0035C9D7C2